MSEPMACNDARCSSTHVYCDNCDLLVGLDGLHVLAVHDQEDAGLVVTVESAPAVMGCPACGVLAHSHGRRAVELIDSPCFGRRVRIRWLKRTWSCPEPTCPVRTFTEQDEQVARPRALLTTRACRWAIGQLRREHASVHGLARQLGTSWATVWRSVRPLLQAAADDESRFARVTTTGRTTACACSSSAEASPCDPPQVRRARLTACANAELLHDRGLWKGIDDLEIAVAESSSGSTTSGCTARPGSSHPSSTKLPTAQPQRDNPARAACSAGDPRLHQPGI